MDVANDEVTWRGSLDVDSKDMLALRKEMTALLQKGLLPSLGVSNVELSVTKPKTQDAYELYLRSQDSVYWSIARNKDAIALLEKSVAMDPGYAPAWLALGLHYSNEADFASGGEQMHNKTVAALERASLLDPGLLLPSIELIEREAFYGDLSASFARSRRWLEGGRIVPKFTLCFPEYYAQPVLLSKPPASARARTNSTPSCPLAIATCSTYTWET